MSGQSRQRGGWLASRAAWAVLSAVAVTVLAYGSIHGSPSSKAARAGQLDTLIKCPACEDLSIAQSDAPSSVTLRHEVAHFVDEGWSDGRIESWVTDRYGAGALLVPQGESAALYVLPVAAAGLGVAGLGWYMWRRRAAGSEDMGAGSGAAR